VQFQDAPQFVFIHLHSSNLLRCRPG
jgi:hypothetical protein